MGAIRATFLVPAKESNWLPMPPKDLIFMVLRMYGPQAGGSADIVGGWIVAGCQKRYVQTETMMSAR